MCHHISIPRPPLGNANRRSDGCSVFRSDALPWQMRCKLGLFFTLSFVLNENGHCLMGTLVQHTGNKYLESKNAGLIQISSDFGFLWKNKKHQVKNLRFFNRRFPRAETFTGSLRSFFLPWSRKLDPFGSWFLWASNFSLVRKLELQIFSYFEGFKRKHEIKGGGFNYFWHFHP